MKILITDRLILRPWNINDSKDFFEYAKTDLVGPRAGWKPHKTEEESKETILFFNKTNNVLAIVLQSENKVIGSIGLHNTFPDKSLRDFNQKELGYALNPNYWGHEYIKEAALAIIDYAFTEMNLDIIWCAHNDTNVNSKRVIEKLNFIYTFEKTNTLKYFNNKPVTILYYLLKKEDFYAAI